MNMTQRIEELEDRVGRLEGQSRWHDWNTPPIKPNSEHYDRYGGAGMDQRAGTVSDMPVDLPMFLDAQVAKALGHKLFLGSKPFPTPSMQYKNGDSGVHHIPSYSTDLKLAMEALEKYASRHVLYPFMSYQLSSHLWKTHLFASGFHDESQQWYAHSENPAEAICRAIVQHAEEKR